MQVKRIYLAGAIEASPDNGAGWRKQITPLLEIKGYQVFNPCIETDGLLAKKLGWDEFSIDKWRELKASNLRKFKEIGEWIVEQDLKAVTHSNIIVTYFDKYVPMGAGTYGEITVARLIKIENLLIVAPDFSREKIPLWVLGCVDKVFDSPDELLSYLPDWKEYYDNTR